MSCIRATIVILVICLSGASYADAGARYSFSFRNSSLHEALDTLIARGIPILYSDGDIRGRVTTAHCEECGEEEAVDAIVRPTGLTWRKVGGQYLISQYPPGSRSGRGTVSGTVEDSLSHEIVSGASIYLLADTGANDRGPSRWGCSTNRYGFFSFPDVPPGAYTLSVHPLGYKLKTAHIAVLPDVPTAPVVIRCLQAEIEMAEIVVERDRSVEAMAAPEVVHVTPATLEKLPALGGESDVLRGLQLLPGVKSISEISSGLFIRGTTSDENLYLLDGATVYNPTHLGGFLSTFNPDALRDVQVSKGMFAPENGGRIGGVVDMMMRDGSQDHVTGSAGLSLLDARLTVEGPLADGTTFMLAGRRVYLDLVLGTIFNNAGGKQDYYFFDVTGKINSRLSPNDRLFASVYSGRDIYTQGDYEKQESVVWGNTIGNLRYVHVFSPAVFTTFSAIYTSYKFETEQNTNAAYTEPSWLSQTGIDDLQFRASMEFYATRTMTISAGAELVHHRIRAEIGKGIEYSAFPLVSRPEANPVEGSFWVSDNWRPRDELSVEAGMRVARFSSTNGSFTRIEPRATTQWMINEDVGLHGALSLSNQFLHSFIDQGLLSFLPTNVMYPATGRVQPSRSFHISAGADTRLFDNSYSLTTDVYWRNMEDIHQFRQGADFSPGTNLEDQILIGSGKSYGFEVLLRRTVGGFSGWIGYSLSWTRLQFDQLNGGIPFYPRWDRRHEIGATFSYALGEHWEFGATWTFATGQPYTLPTGVFYFNDRQFGFQSPYAFPTTAPSLDYASIDGTRLPVFHKLDLVFIHKYHWFGLPFQLSLSLYNAYSRKNPFAWEVKNSHDLSTNWAILITQYTAFPIIPSVGLSVKF